MICDVRCSKLFKTDILIGNNYYSAQRIVANGGIAGSYSETALLHSFYIVFL